MLKACERSLGVLQVPADSFELPCLGNLGAGPSAEGDIIGQWWGPPAYGSVARRFPMRAQN